MSPFSLLLFMFTLMCCVHVYKATRDKYVILRLYKSLVMPRLEYYAQIGRESLPETEHGKTGDSVKKSYKNVNYNNY